MAQDNRDILDILKFELNFLEDGGYGRSPLAPWRVPAIFEDSPICPNFCDPPRPHACDNCRLEQYVPEGQKKESRPCRFMPRTQDGVTVEDFLLHRQPGRDERGPGPRGYGRRSSRLSALTLPRTERPELRNCESRTALPPLQHNQVQGG
jgi:hypothetical protein